MIDPLNEQLIDFWQVCREPAFVNRRRGKPAHISKPYRCCNPGIRSRNGERIKLECVKTSSGLMTSREAIARFLVRLSGCEAAAAQPTAQIRRQQIKKATDELVQAGFEVGGLATVEPGSV